MGMQDAAECMQQAVDLDSRNQAAIAGLAECQDKLNLCRQYSQQQTTAG